MTDKNVQSLKVTQMLSLPQSVREHAALSVFNDNVCLSVCRSVGLSAVSDTAMTLSLTLHCVIGVIEAGKKISTLRKLANYLSNWYSIAWDSLKDRWHLSVCQSSLLWLQFWIKFDETLHGGLGPETKNDFVRGQYQIMFSPISPPIFTNTNASFNGTVQILQYRCPLTWLIVMVNTSHNTPWWQLGVTYRKMA